MRTVPLWCTGNPEGLGRIFATLLWCAAVHTGPYARAVCLALVLGTHRVAVPNIPGAPAASMKVVVSCV